MLIQRKLHAIQWTASNDVTQLHCGYCCLLVFEKQSTGVAVHSFNTCRNWCSRTFFIPLFFFLFKITTTLPTMQLSHQVDQIEFSFFRSHKRFCTTSSTYAIRAVIVLFKSCKHTLLCTIGGVALEVNVLVIVCHLDRFSPHLSACLSSFSLLCVTPPPPKKEKQAVWVTLSKLISFCLCVNSRKNSCHFDYADDLEVLTFAFFVLPLSSPSIFLVSPSFFFLPRHRKVWRRGSC